MRAVLLVFLGGGLGSVLRYGMGLFAAQRLGAFTAASGWPWGTFLVNVIGCFVIGLCYRLLPIPADGPPSARLLLMTGCSAASPPSPPSRSIRRCSGCGRIARPWRFISAERWRAR